MKPIRACLCLWSQRPTKLGGGGRGGGGGGCGDGGEFAGGWMCVRRGGGLDLLGLQRRSWAVMGARRRFREPARRKRSASGGASVASGQTISSIPLGVRQPCSTHRNRAIVNTGLAPSSGAKRHWRATGRPGMRDPAGGQLPRCPGHEHARHMAGPAAAVTSAPTTVARTNDRTRGLITHGQAHRGANGTQQYQRTRTTSTAASSLTAR